MYGKAAPACFRAFKGMEDKVRPIYHRREHRVRTHLFLCMLACYMECRLRRALAPRLCAEEKPPSKKGAGNGAGIVPKLASRNGLGTRFADPHRLHPGRPG